jgi:hypothetical protein
VRTSVVLISLLGVVAFRLLQVNAALLVLLLSHHRKGSSFSYSHCVLVVVS